MSAITVQASTTISGAGSSTPVDSSSYSVLRLSINARPTLTPQFIGARAHFYIETSRDSATWHTLSETVYFTGLTSGPERMPASGITDLAACNADLWVRIRWLVEDAGTWTLSCTGTAQ
ncbi:MAG TPA: hypothetical protein VHC69_31610 [Polyangiaceae bacterium]|nr:hypothetical protein [Polyangiaceae bacterium]